MHENWVFDSNSKKTKITRTNSISWNTSMLADYSDYGTDIVTVFKLHKHQAMTNLLTRTMYPLTNLQFLGNRFWHHPINPTNLNLRLQTNLLLFEQQNNQHTINTIIITFIINTTIISAPIRQIIQSAQNSVYPTIFNLICNLIT